MFSLLKRYREPLIVLLLVVYPLMTFLGAGHRGRKITLLDKMVLGLATPIQAGLTWLFEGTVNGVKGYVAVVGVRERNQELQAENAQLKAKLLSLEEVTVENKRLKALFDYSEATAPKEILARVVGVNPVSNILSVRINRGESDGVKNLMPVLTAEGVVGHVQGVMGSSANVVLLTDRSSRVAVINQRSRVRGTAAGTGSIKVLSLQNVLKSDDVKEGDALITSGTDGVFPKGLRVGVVGKVERKANGMFLEANITPSVQLALLEEILILPVEVNLMVAEDEAQ